MAVEPGRCVAVGRGGGSGVAGRKEPVLSVALAGTFARSCAAQVLKLKEFYCILPRSGIILHREVTCCGFSRTG